MSNSLTSVAVEKLVEQSKSIGGGPWRLFLYILSSAKSGSLETTYSELSKILDSPEVTIKSWRAVLVNLGIVKSYGQRYHVVFDLTDEWKELLEKQESPSPTETDGKPNNGLLPVVVGLVEKVTRLELRLSEIKG